MTPPKSDERRSSVNLERTRQQLQDLDLLLKQMLALPSDGSMPEESAPAGNPEPDAPPAAAETLPQQPATFTVVASPVANVTSMPPVSTEPVVTLRVYAPPQIDAEPVAAVSAPRPPEQPSRAEVANGQIQKTVAAESPRPEPVADPAPAQSTPAIKEKELPAADSATAPASAVIVPLERVAEKPSSAPPPAPQVVKLVPPTPEPPDAANEADIHKFDLTGPVHYDLTPEHGWDALGGSEPPAGSPPYRALVSANRSFDRVLHILGPLGRPLTTQLGRDILGWTGVILLLAAAALGVVGWLSWPISWEVLK